MGLKGRWSAPSLSFSSQVEKSHLISQRRGNLSVEEDFTALVPPIILWTDPFFGILANRFKGNIHMSISVSVCGSHI
jgi:hypothetical protein